MQANGLSLSAPMQGQLASTTDQDWFALSISNPTTIRVSFDSPTSLSSPSWEYHLVRCQNVSGQIFLNFGAAEDKAFDVYFPSAGIYYFIVTKGFDSLVTTPYSFTLVETATVVEREPNDSVNNSTLLPISTPVKGQIASIADLDWYQFSSGTAGQVSIAFDSPKSLSSPSWEYHLIKVVDAQGNLLAGFGTASDLQFNVSIPSAGVYYLSIEKGNDQLLTDPYGITLVSIPSPVSSATISATIAPAVEISWPSKLAKNYVVQKNGSLSAGGWLQVAGPFSGTGNLMRFFDSASSARSFYRIVEQ